MRDLERDEIDEDFCIGVKRFGIGGDVAPKFSKCRRCLRMTWDENSRKINLGFFNFNNEKKLKKIFKVF